MSAPVLLAAGAVKTAVERLLEAGAWRGAQPVIHYGTAGALRDRVLAGEAADAVVTSEEGLAMLREAGLVKRELPLGAAGTGLALRDGATARPIDTAEGLRAALLAAASIGWADPARGATGGRHFEKVIAALGIEEQVRAKGTRFPFGVEAVAACGRGEVEFAVSQATEIIGRPGVSLLGLFPPPHALSTGYAAAALREGAMAEALMALFGSAAARRAMAEIGFTPPA
ncbi:MAG TPA: substrate-binding domain-containing protein [Falsiroseomonas sp.]|jgi:molybdate transport system substrate-binding protein|nr:substrate-binding domain-containing protein [Falsiroseomonas sp.]